MVVGKHLPESNYEVLILWHCFPSCPMPAPPLPAGHLPPCRCDSREQVVFLIIMTHFGHTALISTHKLFPLLEPVPITAQILTLAGHN